MINLLIVDDHQILRAGLELIFETVSDINVLGTANDGEAGLQQVASLHPDLVLTDIRMPKLDGIAMMRQLHDTDPDLPIVVLTTFDDQEPIQQAMQLGAKASY
ncbi:response regulator [Secundilactobacillus similis]|uniref:response regulator n=1 Tax=Secundilactobacillus similis TaxID=414682 RepID=UPI0006D0B6E6|nr:response regulator transcription factor [Secundilactobacillus similis]